MSIAIDNISEINIGQNISRTKKNKRATNYWDILYKPGTTPLTATYNWNIEHSNGPKNSICPSASRLKVENTTFSNCDFDGIFTKLTFTKCTFRNCDFASVWKFIKFNNCEFSSCSLTMTTFRNCKFSDCKWSNISISGSETKLENTVINNPRTFIKSTYTNLDKDTLKHHNKVASYQTYRHEQTKAKLSKKLYDNSKSSSDESIYYDCIRLNLTQSIDAKIYEIKHQIENGENNILKKTVLNLKRSIFSTEKIIINISGWVNGWGGSLLRPATIGVALITIFSVIYNLILHHGTITNAASFFENYLSSFIMSIDITLLFGYTKHLKDDSPSPIQLIGILNATLGLWWYAIFVPTVINRICRVKS